MEWAIIFFGTILGVLVGYIYNSEYSPNRPTKRKRDTTKKIQRVLILIAMEAEAKPLIDELKLKKRAPFDGVTPCEYYTGTVNNMTVSVVTNGKCSRFNVDNVGTTPAAIVAHSAIQYLKPDLVINAGTAGGFKCKDGKIGDVFISTILRHHDRRIPIPGFIDYGRGDHQATRTTAMIKSLGFKAGVVSTSNSLDHTDVDDELMRKNDAAVKDMEGAAIAWVAEMHNVSFFCVKVITDLVDGDRPTEVEFLENLHKAATSLQHAVPKVIKFIAGKSVDDLELSAPE